MNVRDVIRMAADCHLWFRPVSWKGTGVALYVYGGCRIAVVPSPTGGSPWYPRLTDFTCDWEVVNPDDVLDEVDG